jgi:hypothetical protein
MAMRVRELIEKLQQMDQEAYIGAGFESLSGHVNPIERVCTVTDCNDVTIVALDMRESTFTCGPKVDDLEFSPWIEVP